MKYLIKGTLYNPIKMGDPTDWHNEDNETCHDCGAKYGDYHTQGCDMERCPCCGGQLISCDCGAIYVVKKNLSKSELNKLIKQQEIQTEADNLLIKNYLSKDRIIYDSQGESGNIFFILAQAKKIFLEKGIPGKFTELSERVYKADSYDDALKVINEYIAVIDIRKDNTIEL